MPARIELLGVIMPKLFEPIRLRGLTIRNRMWLAPMCQFECENRDGIPSMWHLVHLGARAQGRFGMIVTEATAVVPEGRIAAEDTGIWDDAQAAAWAKIVEFVHSQGAAIALQLAHAGRKASTYRPVVGDSRKSAPVGEYGWETAAPSALAFDQLKVPRAMSRSEIHATVKAFGEGAARAVEAGFDAIEIHAGHGYLLHQFLSPLTNIRTDEYGGPLPQRSRILFEVLDAVRSNVPSEMPVMVRISATDWDDDGFTLEEAKQVAVQLQEAGADLIDVSSGGNLASPDIPLGPSYQVPLASALTEVGVRTGAVGMITDAAQAESILVNGQAEVVFIGRAALRDPSWPLRAAQELGMDWKDIPYPRSYTRGYTRTKLVS